MPKTEFSDHRQVEHDRAVLEVARALREHCGRVATKLDCRTVSSYTGRTFVEGWRIPVEFKEGGIKRLDILVSRLFPRAPPRAALVDRPPFLTWPHIEHDGVLCLLPDSTEIDPRAPADVVLNVLNRSVTMVEALIEGSIVERDFKEEFLTYWFYACDDDSKNIVVLFDPTGPSRVVRTFAHEGLVYVADEVDRLRCWISHRFGPKVAGKVGKQAETAALVWLDEPPLPDEYPKSGADVLKLLDSEDTESLGVLKRTAKSSHGECLVLLGAEGRGGTGLIAMRIDSIGNGGRQSNGRPQDWVHHGFRAGRVPGKVAFNRTFGTGTNIHRTQVERADSAWIHGRGQDPRSRALLDKSVTVFGCGSVGSLVAEHLARSGVGTMVLVDYDTLCWANVGRHALGATASGRKKSVELAKRLQRDYPHLSFFGLDADIDRAVYEDNRGLARNDLVVSTTGNWSAESLLNEWHLKSDFGNPILYGWTEDHAVSGSAVVVAPGGKCLACGIGRTGEPYLKATAWPERADVSTEPSCADHYQPYGAIELAYITAMIANTAIDELLCPSKESYRNIWFSSKVVDFGGRWSDGFHAVLQEKRIESGILRLNWGSARCALCSPS